MSGNFHIFVEGKEDSFFLQGYLGYLNIPVSSGCVRDVEGEGKLGGQLPTIDQKLNDGVKVLIVFDANSNCEVKRRKIDKILESRNVPVFLFPDNQSGGALEDILEKIIKPEHEGVFTCFENYKACLQEKSSEYVLPDKKGKIYSYKEALGALDKGQQFAPRYWDFGNSALAPLKDFLTSNIL